METMRAGGKVLRAPAPNEQSPHSAFVIYLILNCFNCKDGMQGVNKEPRARWERAGAATLALLPKETSLKTWLCIDALEDPTESLLVLH